uniref:Brix domain-containing protein n=1 Tax=Ditylenchus dipsaci TaxID=166011 RepID=A0A915DNL1_9BILA
MAGKKRQLPRNKEIKKQKDSEKRLRREEREKEQADDTYIEEGDKEVLQDDTTDAMANYFSRDITPKILITTSPNAKLKTWKFCFELRKCIPNTEIFTRKNVAIKRIVKQAIEKQFTDLVIVHEDNKRPNGIIISHLPEGPTAYFKINTLEYTKQIKGHGESTSHFPEVVLNNFKTRLGHSVGRLLSCLFPHDPQYTGRRVVTFHNQRDYIFFRHHRYEFKKEGEKAALHELGPRFTLRLKWLQKGTYDSREGEYEWCLKRHEMETSRRKFFL